FKSYSSSPLFHTAISMGFDACSKSFYSIKDVDFEQALSLFEESLHHLDRYDQEISRKLHTILFDKFIAKILRRPIRDYHIRTNHPDEEILLIRLHIGLALCYYHSRSEIPRSIY